MYFVQFIRGMLMAVADSVPGVSGGTIAFILGFYDQFLSSLKAVLSMCTKREKKAAYSFLLQLGSGWIVGFIACVLFLAAIFDSQIYRISSLFIGFILAAVPLIVKQEKEVLTSNYGYSVFGVIGLVVVLLITNFNPAAGSGIQLSTTHFSLGLAIYVYLAGLIAISAMVLPGISGSTLLLIFGLYTPIIYALKEVITLNFSYLPMLIIFGLGILTGVVVTIRGIKYLFHHYRGQMVYLISGLMIGSIYAIIKGPTTLDIPKAAMTFATFDFVFFLLGIGAICALESLKKVK